jgi:para-aminobenzoate synthetase / 4-amino-4-deoxychorismate lyase
MPRLLLDDAPEARLYAYGKPGAVICANEPQRVSAALADVENARSAGHFVAGYFSYELGYALEPVLAAQMPPRQVPLLWFGVFDAPEVIEGAEVNAAFDSWRRDRAYAGPLRHEWTADAYRRRFDRVRDLIAAGDFYQANLTFQSRFAFVGDAMTLYRRLRAQSAARYGAYVDDGSRQILSLSPELFFDLASDGTVTTRPMKGTAPRGVDPATDVLAREGLAESTKDRAENLMIVDLLRNDLGRIARLGSVTVPNLFTVETYPTLHQLVSTVTAKLKPGTAVCEIVRALFPCGSVTGAPKIRAMQVIAELESRPRGVYCGAIGHFAPDGSARFNVAIRTLTITGHHGELGIGGAVVQDSAAESEYAECLLKARYYEAARRPLELIETLRWSPSDGFVRLELHLARMKRSAEVFGIAFDKECARDVLANAVLRPPIDGGEKRIRLTLNEAGEFACAATPLADGKTTWSYVLSPNRVSSTDVLARHKTNWRDRYESDFSHRAPACDEVVFLNERGEVVEGSRTNVFVARGGRLLTPPLSAGCLDGILRRSLIDEGRCLEATLLPAELENAQVYLGNSLRGLMPATLRNRKNSEV